MTGGNGHTEPFAKVTRRLIGEQLYKLRKTDLLVFLFIATHADADTGENAFPGIDTIAAGVHCSREHVSHATARLVAAGLLAKHQRKNPRGGWPSIGYTVVGMVAPGSNHVVGMVAPASNHMVAPASNHMVAPGSNQWLPHRATDQTKDQTIELEEEPPSGPRAHTREGGEGFSDQGDQEVDRAQTSLLLPIPSGDRARAARLALIKSYNPSPALVDWAAERAVSACSDDVLGKWQDTRIRDNKLPRDLEEAEADFRLWIRNEKHFANRHAEPSRRSRQHSTPAEDEAAARFYAEMSAVRANGGAANG